MADLAATDVTVAIVHKDLTQRRRLNLVTITLGDGSKTIPAGGVPLPALSKFGIHSDLQLFFTNANVCGLPVDYDKTNHKLVYWMGNYDASDGPLIAATGQTPASHVLRALAYGK